MKKSVEKLEHYKDQIRAFFLRLAPDTPLDQLNQLIDEFSFEVFPKKKMIITSGESSDMVYFICEGLVRIYYIKEGKEITNWFLKENNAFAATYYVLTGKENEYFYEALERTAVMKVRYPVLESYYAKYHALEHLGRKLIEQYYVMFIKRSNEVCFMSAEEKYDSFLRDHAEIMNRVSLRNIASYLGISQETLSRLRARH